MGGRFGNLSFKQSVSSHAVFTTFWTLTITIIGFLRGIFQPSSHVKQIVSSGEYYFCIITVGFNNSIAPCRNVGPHLYECHDKGGSDGSALMGWPVQHWVEPENHQFLLEPVRLSQVSLRTASGVPSELTEMLKKSCSTACLTECSRVQISLWFKPKTKSCLHPNRNCVSSD